MQTVSIGIPGRRTTGSNGLGQSFPATFFGRRTVINSHIARSVASRLSICARSAAERCKSPIEMSLPSPIEMLRDKTSSRRSGWRSMTVIQMSERELIRLRALIDLSDNRLTSKVAGALMGVGRRQVYRLRRAFAAEAWHRWLRAGAPGANPWQQPHDRVRPARLAARGKRRGQRQHQLLAVHDDGGPAPDVERERVGKAECRVRRAACGERPVAERRPCPRHLGLERRRAARATVRRTASARTSSRIIASAAA